LEKVKVVLPLQGKVVLGEIVLGEIVLGETVLFLEKVKVVLPLQGNVVWVFYSFYVPHNILKEVLLYKYIFV
jgi:hypothetical protein